MTLILAIDPGPVESAWVLIDETCRPLAFAKEANGNVRSVVSGGRYPYDALAVEMIEGRGMVVGQDVFETCVEIGRMIECARGATQLVYRRLVKRHHCGTPAAKDSNITQSLVDRFAKGERNRGKGTKDAPGWFFGFADDVWQAYALAVYVADKELGP